MKFPLAWASLLGVSVLWACGGGGEGGDGLPAASSEQCCPLARLCDACGCEPSVQMAVDADDTQACIQDLASFEGCREEVRGSAERTCDANGQRPDTVVETSIVGDWFMCSDAECTELVSSWGTRYTADGRVVQLTFPQPPDRNSIRPSYEGDPYCVVAELGTYRYDVVTGELESTLAQQQTPSTSTFFVSGDYSSRGMLRVRENATGIYATIDSRPSCDVSGSAPL